MRIGILVASTRPLRIGGTIADWVAARVAATGAEVDLLDLAELRLPFLDELTEPLEGRYALPHTIAWAERIAALEGLVIVTAEYNSSIPAPLKNALDMLGPEWVELPVGIVAYGGASSGTRVVQALLPVLFSLQTLAVGALYLPRRRRIIDGVFHPADDDELGLGEVVQRMARLPRRALGVSP